MTTVIDKRLYYEPTLFVDVDNEMTAAQEEIFGPILLVIPFARTPRTKRGPVLPELEPEPRWASPAALEAKHPAHEASRRVSGSGAGRKH